MPSTALRFSRWSLRSSPFRVHVLALGVGLSLGLLGVSACKGGSDGDAGSKAESASAAGTPTGANGGEADGADPQPAVPAKDPAEIIEAHVEAVGGADARESIEAMHFESKLDTGAQQVTAAAHHWWVADGRFYEIEEIPGFGVAKVGHDGTKVWSDDPINGPRELTGLERSQALWTADPFHWFHWKDYHPVARYLGEVEGEDGAPLDRVELSPSADAPESARLVADFDPETHLLARLSYTQAAPTGPVPLRFVFSDYRDEGPLKIAHRQTAKTPIGQMTQVYAEVELNGGVDESQFAMPGADAAVPPDDGSGTGE